MELNTAQEKEDFSQKSTYSVEEKKYIMEQLDAQRRKEQEKKGKKKYAKYSEEEKKQIFKELNEKRLEEQIYNEIKKKRTFNKKIYTFDIRRFYKLINMERGYFILVEDAKKLTARPQLITLYYKTFGELKKRDFLMKTEIYSDKLFVSNDVLRVYFKGYSLEDKH